MFWSLQRAPPQEWCCSCWWNRNRPWGAPPHDGLASHPYRQKTFNSRPSDLTPFLQLGVTFVAVNLNLDVSERFKTHMVSNCHCLTADLPGEDTSSQAHRGVIGSLQHLHFCFKRKHGHDGTKDLLLHASHLICAVPCWRGKKRRRGSVETDLETVP